MNDATSSPVALARASKMQNLRKAIAIKAVRCLMGVVLPVRVSEKRAKIVEMMVSSMIATDTPVYTI